jgi:hypothetical protein
MVVKNTASQIGDQNRDLTPFGREEKGKTRASERILAFKVGF